MTGNHPFLHIWKRIHGLAEAVFGLETLFEVKQKFDFFVEVLRIVGKIVFVKVLFVEVLGHVLEDLVVGP